MKNEATRYPGTAFVGIPGVVDSSGTRSSIVAGVSAPTFAQMKAAREAFWESVVLQERRARRVVREQNLGKEIEDLAFADKRMSQEQIDLSRTDLRGFPRLIRGVAGSGKSVVLANMVARHLASCRREVPLFAAVEVPPRVAVVCFNRALVPFLREKIGASFRHLVGQDLPVHSPVIRHLNQLVYELCTAGRGCMRYISVGQGDAQSRAREYLGMIERLARSDQALYRSICFDAVFVDEGQDLVPEEYMLLLALCRQDPATREKNLIVFYDDAQNLYARPRPSWKEIGIDVQRGDRSRVMRQCFRNPREVVELGFNVLLGKQAPDSRAVRNRLFAEVNWLKRQGLVEEFDSHLEVKFAARSSAPPVLAAFDSRQKEKEWLAREIVRLIYEEDVRPDDMLVLFEYEAEFKDLEGIIRRMDHCGRVKGFVKPYGANQSDKDGYIFKPEHLTISTTKGAKGYDAHVLFLCGADIFKPDDEGRASFYVGATRARLRLHVTGLGREGSLMTEALRVSALLATTGHLADREPVGKPAAWML
jgi:superfamily I DNA and RNA helicase